MSDNTHTQRTRVSYLLATAATILILVGCVLLWNFTYGSVSTDDAQVDGHIHPINSRIGGTVVWVNPAIDDTKYVTAGTVLARLDTNDYSPTVDRLQGDVQAQEAQLRSAQLAVPITSASATSKLSSAKAALAAAQAELASAKAGEMTAEAMVNQTRASAQRAEKDRVRYEQLVQTHEISRSEYDARMTEANVTSAQLSAAQANVLAAKQKVLATEQLISERQDDVANASTAPEQIQTAQSAVQRVAGELKKSQAALHDATLNLGYTEILAPISGIIGRRSLEVGQRVAVGQLLLDIVPINDLWVTANFKETQLRHVSKGDGVSIHIDTYGATIQGSVESIGGATGAKYALIAPDNATGNYVKVVQRIPVRIRVDTMQVNGKPLLPGMSVEVKVR